MKLLKHLKHLKHLKYWKHLKENDLLPDATSGCLGMSAGLLTLADFSGLKE